jgi:hypothetical protein
LHPLSRLCPPSYLPLSAVYLVKEWLKFTALYLHLGCECLLVGKWRIVSGIRIAAITDR